MKLLLTIACCCFFTMLMAQQPVATTNKLNPSIKTDTLETACGMCQFDMKGEDCALAVRIAGKGYYVDGTNIDQHGDAHAKDGFCNAIRKAAVQGAIVNNRYKVTYFKLLPVKTEPLKIKE